MTDPLTLPDLMAMIAVTDDTESKQRIVRLAYTLGDLDGYRTASMSFLELLAKRAEKQEPTT